MDLNKKMKISFSQFILVILLLIVFGCTGYYAIGPQNGETYKFYSKRSHNINPNSSYDFEKLNNGYGLLIFSYEINGKIREKHSKSKKDNLEGIRIYEHRFKPEDSNFFTDHKKFELYGISKHGLSITNRQVSYKYFYLPFGNGQIIYGGRIFADSDNDSIYVEDLFDEDCKQFIETFGDRINDIPIETKLIQRSLRKDSDEPKIIIF